jgi:2-polyprenyl-3-methyl-5-hydroxy-6-metoxy-1,4-benzoquinol methylase
MKKQSLLFWDLMAKRYAKTPVANEAAYQHKLEKTREYLHPDTELFEFGCGTGSTAITHAPHVRHILATDGSIKMIEIAEGKADAAGIENITFDAVTIDVVSAPTDNYDVVLGMSILHLVKNKGAVIAKVHNLLKPGGVFISSTACLGNTSVLITLLSKVIWMIGITLRPFTPEQLKASLVEAGFAIEYDWLPDGDGVKVVFIVARKHS